MTCKNHKRAQQDENLERKVPRKSYGRCDIDVPRVDAKDARNKMDRHQQYLGLGHINPETVNVVLMIIG